MFKIYPIKHIFNLNDCYYFEFINEIIVKEKNELNIAETTLENFDYIFSIYIYDKRYNSYRFKFFKNKNNQIFCKIITIEDGDSYSDKKFKFYSIENDNFYILINFLFLHKFSYMSTEDFNEE